jgi:hypothetical protein
MRGARPAHVRDRSRWARERSHSLRVTSQQLRESLERLRPAGQAKRNLPQNAAAPAGAPPPLPALRTPLDFASLMRERVYKARLEARALRRRAADLRSQAAEFRARSEDLRSNSAAI